MTAMADTMGSRRLEAVHCDIEYHFDRPLPWAIDLQNNLLRPFMPYARIIPVVALFNQKAVGRGQQGQYATQCGKKSGQLCTERRLLHCLKETGSQTMRNGDSHSTTTFEKRQIAM